MTTDSSLSSSKSISGMAMVPPLAASGIPSAATVTALPALSTAGQANNLQHRPKPKKLKAYTNSRFLSRDRLQERGSSLSLHTTTGSCLLLISPNAGGCPSWGLGQNWFPISSGD